MSAAATPRASGDQSSLLAAGSILAKARLLEEEVKTLRGEAQGYRSKVMRWEDLKSARVASKREAAGADLVVEKGKAAGHLEKTARGKQLNCFVESKTREHAFALASEEKRVAEEEAKRIEAQLEAARTSLSKFRAAAEATEDEAKSRLSAWRDGVKARLLEAEEDAKVRVATVETSVGEETVRTEGIIGQEQERLYRQYQLREAAAERQRTRMEHEVQSREASAIAAEAHRDREWAILERRALGANSAARAKIRLALEDQERISHATLMRKNNAQYETGARMEQARLREEAAKQGLEDRKRQAERSVAIARARLAAVEEECEETKRAQDALLDNARQSIAQQKVAWQALVEEAEACTQARIEELRKTTEELQQIFVRELHDCQLRVNEEILESRKMLRTNEKMVNKDLEEAQKAADAAHKLMMDRVHEAEFLAAHQALRRKCIADSHLGSAQTIRDRAVLLSAERVSKEQQLFQVSYLGNSLANEAAPDPPTDELDQTPP